MFGVTSPSATWLRRRMEELKLSEQRATVEDLMYASVLERFVELGVPMLPRVESIVESPGDLKSLTEGVHSREARLFFLCTSFNFLHMSFSVHSGSFCDMR